MDETGDRTEVDGCCAQYDVSRLSGRGVCGDPDSGLRAPEGQPTPSETRVLDASSYILSFTHYSSHG